MVVEALAGVTIEGTLGPLTTIQFPDPVVGLLPVKVAVETLHKF